MAKAIIRKKKKRGSSSDAGLSRGTGNTLSDYQSQDYDYERLSPQEQDSSGPQLAPADRKRRLSNISTSGSDYSAISEYLDTRGKFSPDYSKSRENITGTVTHGRTVSKYGDPNFAETAYSAGYDKKSLRGGEWDRSGTTFTPGKKSYTAKRTPAGRGHSYSLEELKSV